MTSPAPAASYRRRVPVVDPAGVRHESFYAAALANGVRPTTVMVNARLQRGGWRMAEPADAPAPTKPAA